MHHTGGHIQIVLSGDAKHILNDTLMIGASFLAGRQNVVHFQKDYFSVLCSDDITQKFLSGYSRVVFRKNLSPTDVSEYDAVSPLEINHDIDATGFYKPDLVDGRSGSEDDVVFLESALTCPQAVEELCYFVFSNTAKKLRVCQKKCIHKTSN